MPRQARKKSETGIYHVMLRGINQQQIFEDEEDYEKFIQVIKDCKAISGFELYAYCLMSNHVHLLIKEEKESLEKIFRRIGSRYVYWYNVKYQRVGHLFQDRYKSEPVEDDKYILSVARYIHQNPMKAKVTDNIKYKYSSYSSYLKEDNTLVDTHLLLSMMTKAQFIDFNKQSSNEKFIEIEENKKIRITDEKAKEIILENTKCKNISEYIQLSEKCKETSICEFHKKGMSIRQISRLTGISKGKVEKFLINR